MGCATGLRYPRHPKVTAHQHLRGRTTTAPFRAVRAARRPDECHGFPPGPYTTTRRLVPCAHSSSRIRCITAEVTTHRHGRVHRPRALLHRWPLTQWQNPFRTGEGRTALESVLHYARWIADHLENPNLSFGQRFSKRQGAIVILLEPSRL